MRTVMAFGQKDRGTSQGREDKAPARLTTTLYDLMTAIQAVVGPDDTRVVRTVVHLIRSGQLTYPGKGRPRRRSVHDDKLRETFKAFHPSRMRSLTRASTKSPDVSSPGHAAGDQRPPASGHAVPTAFVASTACAAARRSGPQHGTARQSAT